MFKLVKVVKMFDSLDLELIAKLVVNSFGLKLKSNSRLFSLDL